MVELCTRPMETSVYSLCDDILVEIFSYIDTNCLIMSVYEVCSHWKYLVDHDLRIWRNRWLVWHISKPVSVLSYYLRRAPLLKGLKLIFLDDIAPYPKLRDILSIIPQVRKVEIHSNVTYDILHYINANISHLYVMRISRQDYSFLIQFKNIETLNLGDAYDFCGRHLRIIADNCSKLKNLHLGGCRALVSLDIAYFLKQLGTQIENLEISGYGIIDNVFISMVQCENLQMLNIHDSRLMNFSTVDKLIHSNIKTLILSRLKHRCNIPAGLPQSRFITLNFD